jgi:hypothetical protein
MTALVIGVTEHIAAITLTVAIVVSALAWVVSTIVKVRARSRLIILQKIF